MTSRKPQDFCHFSCSQPAQLQVEGHPSICVQKVTEESRVEMSHKFLWIARALRELFREVAKAVADANERLANPCRGEYRRIVVRPHNFLVRGG